MIKKIRFFILFLILLVNINWKYQDMDAYYLNVGSSSSHTDVNGKVWQADVEYSEERGYGYVNGGNTGNSPEEISNTEDDPLYQSNRWGDYLEFWFDVPAANKAFEDGGGYYKVTLKFSETYWDSADKRKFNVNFNDLNRNERGYRLMGDADIFALSGGKNRAYDWVVPAFPVNEGRLKITLYGNRDNAVISGIAVERVPYTVGDIGMTDEEFVDKVEHAVFNWFYENSVPPYYFPPSFGPNDSRDYGFGTSISSIGPSLALMCIGHYRGWITYEDAYNRVKGMLDGISLLKKGPEVAGSYPNSPYETYYHYYDRFFPFNPQPGFDPVRDVTDNGNLLVGMILPAEYFRGTEIEVEARQLLESLDFNKMNAAAGYAEWMTAFAVNAGTPRESTIHWGMVDSFNNADPGGALPLYFHQWLNVYFDFRHTYTSRGWNGGGRNDYLVSRNNTLILRSNMVHDWTVWPDEYNTYDWDAWGITAATHMFDGDYGIADAWGDPGGDIDPTRAGNLNPFATVASLPFAPDEVLTAIKHMYWRFYKLGYPEYMQRGIWNDKYGFVQTYNIGSVRSRNTGNWVNYYVNYNNAGFDMGPQVLACENYRTGMPWHYYRYSDIFLRACNRLGLTGLASCSFGPPVSAALKKQVVTSSNAGSNTGDKAVDDDKITRWESEASDPQYIFVDLGWEQDIGTVALWWEAAYAKKYSIDISNDGSSWTTVFNETNGNGGVDRIFFRPRQKARYVRMYGTERGTVYGYSLWMFEVFNDDIGEPEFIDDFEREWDVNRLYGGMGTWGSAPISSGRETDMNKVYSGARAYWIDYDVTKQGSDGGWFTALDHYDARMYKYLSLMVKGENGGEEFQVRLKSSDGREYGRYVSSYVPDKIKTSYQNILIDLTSYENEVDLSDLENLNLYFSSSFDSSNSTIYIDDIRYYKDGEEPGADKKLISTPANFLINPGFEYGTGSGAEYWSKWGETGRETWASRKGGFGIAFYGWKPGSNGGVYQDVNIRGNVKYLFSFYSKKEENFNAVSAQVKLEWLDDNDSQVGFYAADIIDSVTTSWQKFIIQDESPASAKKVRAVLSCDNYEPVQTSTASLLFDDVKLVPLYIDNFESNDGKNILSCSIGSFGSGSISHGYNSVNVYDGNYSYNLNYDVSGDGYDAGWFTILGGYNADDYNFLSLKVKGKNGGEKCSIRLKSTNGIENSVNISNYLSGGITTSWQDVYIPLKDFIQETDFDITSLDNMNIYFSNGSGEPLKSTIYIDDVQFILEGEQVLDFMYIDNFETGTTGINNFGGTISIYGNIFDNYEPDTLSGLVYDGNYARWITFDVSDSNAVWSTSLENFNAYDYSYVTFMVKGKNGKETFKICLKDSSAGISARNVDAYLSGGITTAWKQVKIPLSHFTHLVDITSLSSFELYFYNSPGNISQSTIYIDELKFINTGKSSISSAPSVTLTKPVSNFDTNITIIKVAVNIFSGTRTFLLVNNDTKIIIDNADNYETDIILSEGEGSYVINAVACNNSGILSSVSNSVIVKLDTNPPILIKQKKLPFEGSKLGYDNITISFYVYDRLSEVDTGGIKVYLNSEAGTSNITSSVIMDTMTLSITDRFTENKHVLSIYSFDNIGNADTYTLSFTVDLHDTSTPSVTGGYSSYVNKETVDLRGTCPVTDYTLEVYDYDSMVKSVQFTSTEWEVEGLPVETDSVKIYNFRIKKNKTAKSPFKMAIGTDNSYSPFSQGVRVYYDSVLPEINIVSPLEGSTLIEKKISVYAKINDNISTPSVCSVIVADIYSGTAAVDNEGYITQWIDLPAVNNYTVTVEAEDLAGNKKTALRKFVYQPSSLQEDLTKISVYPNPFKPNDGDRNTGVKYDRYNINSGIIFDNLTGTSLKIEIYSLIGRLVYRTEKVPLSGRLQWDVCDSKGEEVSSGVYIYIISNNYGEKKTGKLCVIR